MVLSGFITNLGKYNEGELVGEWINFPIDEEELEEVLERIGINEYYEEYFFTDFESDFEGMREYFGEYPNIEEVNEVCEIIEGFSYWEEVIFRNACEVWSVKEVLANDIDNYSLIDAYSDYDIGYYWIEESGCYNLSELDNLANYIDYEAFGRDVRLESNGNFCSNGFIEYIG